MKNTLTYSFLLLKSLSIALQQDSTNTSDVLNSSRKHKMKANANKAASDAFECKSEIH